MPLYSVTSNLTDAVVFTTVKQRRAIHRCNALNYRNRIKSLPDKFRVVVTQREEDHASSSVDYKDLYPDPELGEDRGEAAAAQAPLF